MSKSTITPGPYHWEKARTLQHLHSEGNFEGISIPLNHPLGPAIAAVPDMIEALKSAKNQPHSLWCDLRNNGLPCSCFVGMAERALTKAGQIE